MNPLLISIGQYIFMEIAKVFIQKAKVRLKGGMPKWYKIANKELGVTEYPGPEDNPRVVKYHQVTSLKATRDHIPWCSSFACWCMEKAGLVSPRSAAALDWLSWGRHIAEPQEGCVVVFSRPGRVGAGHVGFYVKETEEDIYVLGGNQRNRVSVVPYSKKKFLDYRMPSN